MVQFQCFVSGYVAKSCLSVSPLLIASSFEKRFHFAIEGSDVCAGTVLSAEGILQNPAPDYTLQLCFDPRLQHSLA